MFANAGADIGGGYAASSDDRPGAVGTRWWLPVPMPRTHHVDEAYEPVAASAPVDGGVASWVGIGGAGLRVTGSKFARKPSVYNGFGTGGSGSTDA